MKKRMLATVLTLAMLCPILAYFATFGASAALEVDDGVSGSSSNIISEEWNFDDMAEGEVLTNGYISSHARGDFTSAVKSIEALAKPENFSAVADTAGGSYIYADNAYLAFQDHNLLLLRNTYEISWRLKVDAIGSSTTLLWWSNTENAQNRNCLLRYNSNGTLGYTTNAGYESTVTTSVKAPVGEWHNYRARISPTDGRMWLWLDGEIVLNGVVNEYLRDNAKDSESSLIGIFYAWGGSGMKASIDDVKITGVTLDEHLTFDRPTAEGEAFSASWNFDAKPASTDKVTVSAGNGYTVGVVNGDTENTTSVASIIQSSGNYEGPLFTLAGKASDYGKVTFSWKMKYNYSSNYTNIFRIKKSDGSYEKLFRIIAAAKPTEENPSPTAIAHLFSDNGTDMGKIKYGTWTDFKITIYPNASKMTVNVGGTITQLNTNATITSILDGLRDNDKALEVMLFAQYGPVTEYYIDDVAIEAEPVSYSSEELLDFEELTTGSTVNDSVFKDTIKSGLFSLTTDGDGNIAVADDPSDSGNKVLYDTNKRLYLDFLAPTSNYENLKFSFDVRFEGMGGHTSFMSSYACGSQGNFLRIKSDANALQNAGDSVVIATLTQGTDAKWYSFDMDIVTSTGAVALTVTERDSGTAVATYSWTDANIKNSYTNGEALGFRMHYCWNANFKVYFDDIYVKTYMSAVETVNSEWKDSSFTMTTSPDISGMANDDWEIATDPMLLTPPLAASWDFNDGALATKNDIAVKAGSNYTIADNTLTIKNRDSNDAYVSGTVTGPTFTLPGTVNDYSKISVSFKTRIDYNNNLQNIFRVPRKDGGLQNLFRITKLTNGETVNANLLANNGTTAGTLNIGEWHDFKVDIDLSENAENLITVTFDGTTVKKVTGNETVSYTLNKTSYTTTFNEIFADMSSDNRAFSFMLYYHTGMKAELYFDDVSISATPKLDYTENDVLKTVTDTEGNTRGIFVIQDKEQYLTKQPFELSFDYMMNQKPSGYLNFVKMKMTGTSFAIFRLAPSGVVTNYTSSGYIAYYQNKTANSGDNLALNVSSKTLTAGQWYNFRIVFDPNTGHVMGYIDNVLVCDYNINDVYIDENGTPLGITKNPDRMYIELASQYSASDIKTNDSCFDNLRIRTLNYNEYTRTVLSDADFDSTSSGELTADTFAKATGLYAKSLGGSFTVAGTDVAKYVDATVQAGEGIAVDMTNGYAPLATETVSFEGNFTFTAFGDGKMNIYSLKRDDGDAVSLLSVDNSGKLFVGTSDMGYTLSLGTTYNIKLLFSGVAGTGELYVNGKFVGATDILTQSDIPALSYSDSMGNTVNAWNKKFLTSESETVKSLSGVKLQSAEMPDPFKTEFPEDTLNFLAVEGDGTWNVKFDDLSFKIDRYANIYSDELGEGFSFTDVNGRLWGNKFITQFTCNSDSSEIVSLVDWKLGDSDVSLLKTGNGKLYAADGTTELAVLESDADIAVAVNSEYWESQVAANNYPIDVIVYVDGTVVGSYNVTKSTATSSGALSFGEGVSDVKVYMGNAIRDNRAPADVGGAKFEGYNALFIDFEDEKFFETAEKNAINYVEWVYSGVGKTVTDWEGATVKLSEYVTDGDNSFFRIRRPELSGKPSAYMEYNLAAMGEYSALYSVELDMRYVDNISSSMCIARLYSKNMSGEINLLSVDYENRFYFINNGIRYYLCDVTGNDLVCNKPSDDSFTEVGLVINEAEGYYSIWINGRNAYYYGDGQSSGKVTRAGEIKLDYETNESYTLCDPKIRLFEGSDNAGSDCVADIDNVSIDVIKNGFAPVNYNYQVNELGDAVRFVATVDTLYTNSVGFEVTASSNLESKKPYSASKKVVYSSIIAGKDSENNNIVITAEDLGGRYITVFSITDLPTADYTFTVRPFVEVFGKKIYGQETVYLFPES